MIQAVVSVSILVILVFGILMGVLRARKKPLSVMIFRLALTVIALPIAVLLTTLVSGAAADGAVHQIGGFLSLPEEIFSSEFMGIVQVFCAAGIAAILFLIIFPVVAALLRIPVKPLARLLDRKILHGGKKDAMAPENADSVENPTGSDGFDANASEGGAMKICRLILGGLCGLIYAVAMLSPVVGTVKIAGDVTSLPAVMVEEQDAAAILNAVSETGDALPVKAVWYLGAAPIYQGITTYRVDGIRMSVTTETALLGDLADYLRDPAEDKGPFSRYSGALKKSALIGEILPKTFETMFESWASGGSYLGISIPESDGMAGEILNSGLLEFSSLSSEQLRDSMLSVADLTAYLLDSGGVRDMDSLLTDEDRLTDVYACLISSEVLHDALKSALDSGLQAMTAKWSGSGIVLENVLPTDEEGTRNEARALAHATVSLIRFQENFSLERESLSETLYDLGSILDGFRDSELIGEEQVRELMESAIRSDTIKDALGYDTERAEEAINDVLKEIENESYADLLSGLAEKMESTKE